ncbi:hypothetical protein SKA34_12325 [Photobacterium sp. SKA34]|nr:hypothetical protein SKA34_12325 [Photobacterium sp. SKA34]
MEWLYDTSTKYSQLVMAMAYYRWNDIVKIGSSCLALV